VRLTRLLFTEEFLTCAASGLSKTGHFLLGRDIHTRYYEMSTVPYLNDLPTYTPLRLIFFFHVYDTFVRNVFAVNLYYFPPLLVPLLLFPLRQT
jgi:hypothetical protein